jgi:hypothetical protein
VGDVVGFGEGGEEWPGEVSRWRSRVRKSVSASYLLLIPVEFLFPFSDQNVEHESASKQSFVLYWSLLGVLNIAGGRKLSWGGEDGHVVF